MSTFNITRFGQTLKCQMVNSRKDWLLVFSIYIVALTFLNIFFVRNTTFDGGSYHEAVAKHGVAYMEDAYVMLIQGVTRFNVIFFGIAMLFCANFIFYHLKKTPQRSAYFMWPASNLEKFIVCLLTNVVLAAIGTAICIVIADALRVLVDAVDGRVIIWGIPVILDAISYKESIWWLTLAMMLLLHAAYILGGTLFRKQQFVLTTISVIIISYLLVFIWHSPLMGNPNVYDKGPNAWFYIVTIGGFLLTALFYWLSYKIFCRMQVINNKWLNV